VLRAGVALRLERVEAVLNQNARGLREGSALGRRLGIIAERCGVRVHRTTTRSELDRVVGDMASRSVDAVILAGGDGSCTAGLSALALAFGPKRLPRIAIAPAGTVGTIAKNLGLAGRGRAERVMASVATGSVRERSCPTLRVTDDRDVERIGFIFGAGLVARFFEVYEASPRKGLGAAARIAARVFAGAFVGSPLSRRVLSPGRCALSVDGKTHTAGAWSLIVASVLRDVGLHVLVTYRAGEDPNRFHVVASGISPSALGPQLPRVLLGWPLRGEPRVDTLASSAAIDFAGEAGAFVLDGDLFRARSIIVRTGPPISLLVPE
jgi:diacylglycerol kinase (ATP)